MTHIFTRGGLVGSFGHGIIDTNTTTVKFLHDVSFSKNLLQQAQKTYDAVQLLDTLGGILSGCHSDETKTTGAIGLHDVSNFIMYRVA